MMYMIKGIFGVILLLAYLIVTIGSLFVLRVAICWFWDIDYVDLIKRHGGNHERTDKTDKG